MNNDLQCNPLNIRASNQRFQGEIPSLNQFKAFESMAYGLRAGAKILLTYYRIDGLNTITEIISRWAPSSENDTTGYIAFVAQRMGMSAYEAFKVSDVNELTLLVDSMAHRENPIAFTSDDLKNGVLMALGLSLPETQTQVQS